MEARFFRERKGMGHQGVPVVVGNTRNWTCQVCLGRRLMPNKHIASHDQAIFRYVEGSREVNLMGNQTTLTEHKIRLSTRLTWTM